MANSIHKPNFTKQKCLVVAAITGAIFIYYTMSLWKFTDVSNMTLRPNIIYCNPILGPAHNNTSQDNKVLINKSQDPEDKTFYDDPTGTHYTVEKPMMDWDEKRKAWLKHHPSFASGIEDRMLVVTGSQPRPCEFRTGDHMLLRFFKNKVDYCRIHRCEIFYNNAFLEPSMTFCWAKIPLVRAAMVAHPEVEWILWIDVDAIFTDMSFTIPFEKFKDYNFVVHGWPTLVFGGKSWLGLNAGVFLIQNCQWSMDFLDAWAQMGPRSPDHEKWGKIFQSTFTDKTSPYPDDQSALVYLLLKENEKWGGKIHIQNEYSLNSYWIDTVGKLDNISKKYEELERGAAQAQLRRRRAEAVSESYAAEEGELQQLGEWRRPFITHFAGCQPCNGAHGDDPAFQGDSRWVGIERALNFADNQVLRNYGFVHQDIRDGSSVSPLPFDYPKAEI